LGGKGRRRVLDRALTEGGRTALSHSASSPGVGTGPFTTCLILSYSIILTVLYSNRVGLNPDGPRADGAREGPETPVLGKRMEFRSGDLEACPKDAPNILRILTTCEGCKKGVWCVAAAEKTPPKPHLREGATPPFPRPRIPDEGPEKTCCIRCTIDLSTANGARGGAQRQNGQGGWRESRLVPCRERRVTCRGLKLAALRESPPPFSPPPGAAFILQPLASLQGIGALRRLGEEAGFGEPCERAARGRGVGGGRLRLRRRRRRRQKSLPAFQRPFSSPHYPLIPPREINKSCSDNLLYALSGGG
jgi:hypothetical protein